MFNAFEKSQNADYIYIPARFVCLLLLLILGNVSKVYYSLKSTKIMIGCKIERWVDVVLAGLLYNGSGSCSRW